MHIDWFTLLAQIFNFLLLVGLLTWVLYKPITQAMAQRQQTIVERLQEASKARAEAAEEAAQYRHRLQELEARREELMAQARQDVEARKRDWLQEAREFADRARAEWWDEVARERRDFLREMRRRTGRAACTVARRALEDLAGSDLEDRLLSVFLERLREIEPASLKPGANGAGGVTLFSTWELTPQQQERAAEALTQLLGTECKPRFERASDLLCGVALQTAGRRVEWNLAAYLDDLEQEFLRALTRQDESATEEGDEQSLAHRAG